MSWRKVVVAVLVMAVFLALAGVGALKLYHRVFTSSTTGHDQFEAIACPTTLGCWAVGSLGTVTDGDVLGASDRALVELLNGNQRSLPAEPGLIGDGVALDTVACAGAHRCFAAGGDLAGAVIAEWTQGGNWNLIPRLPYRTRGRSDTIGGVACPTVSLCLAYGNRHSALAYLLRWERSDPRWSPVYTPLDGTSITSIGCADGARCFFGTAHNGVFERLAGKWAQVGEVPAHEGGADVGCASDIDCVVTLTRSREVLRWNGTTWSRIVPHPGAEAYRLVSCVPSGCWLEASLAGAATLLRQVSGGWRVVPLPAELSANLGGIGCMITRCLAVGAHRRVPPAPAYAWSAATAVLPS